MIPFQILCLNPELDLQKNCPLFVLRKRISGTIWCAPPKYHLHLPSYVDRLRNESISCSLRNLYMYNKKNSFKQNSF